jgi:hypothetical protein
MSLSRSPGSPVARAPTALAPVTLANVIADRLFFSDHPHRLYRVHSDRVIRRHGRDTFLRTALATPVAGDPGEATCCALWWHSAYPDMAPAIRTKLAKAADPPTKRRRPAALVRKHNLEALA